MFINLRVMMYLVTAKNCNHIDEVYMILFHIGNFVDSPIIAVLGTEKFPKQI